MTNLDRTLVLIQGARTMLDMGLSIKYPFSQRVSELKFSSGDLDLASLYRIDEYYFVSGIWEKGRCKNYEFTDAEDAFRKFYESVFVPDNIMVAVKNMTNHPELKVSEDDVDTWFHLEKFTKVDKIIKAYNKKFLRIDFPKLEALPKYAVVKSRFPQGENNNVQTKK